MGNPSGRVQTIPLLSPTMESELFNEPEIYPQATMNISSAGHLTLSFWEENFQDLSNWCGELPSPTRFHARLPMQEPCNFPTDEPVVSKESGAKGNRNHLSAKNEGAKGLREAWTLGSNAHSSGLSVGMLQPLPQQKTICDMPDVWSNLPSPAAKFKEPRRADASNRIPNKVEEALNSNQDFTTDTVEPLFLIAEEDNATGHESVATSNYKNMAIEDEYLASFDSADYKYEQRSKQNEDSLHIFDTGLDSFDLLSYVCDDKTNFQHKTPSTKTMVSPTTTVPKSPLLARCDTIKGRSRRNISQTRAKSKPHTLPLQMPAQNLKTSVNVTPATKRNVKGRGKKRYSEDNDFEDNDSDSGIPESSYRELRERNNEASRKSRNNKKMKASEMVKQATKLERDNRILKMKVEELDKLVTSMRMALLRSALVKDA